MWNIKKIIKFANEKDLIELNSYLDPIVISLIFFILFKDSISDLRLLVSYILGSSFIVNYSFSKFGIYSSFRYKSLYNLANKIFTGWIFTFSIFLGLNLFLEGNFLFDNLKFISWFIFSGIYFFVSHLFLRKILRVLLIKGFNRKKVIFYGSQKDIMNFEYLITRNRWIGDEIIVFFEDKHLDKIESFNNSKYKGGFK